MNSNKNDTIAAISTAIGEGGIGIIRISGDLSFNIAKKIFVPKGKREFDDFVDRKLYLGNIVDKEGKVIDEVLIAKFKGPCTYTREDMVEINCHGGLIAQKNVLRSVLEHGARMAEPGEFTKRAFLNGRIDLSQAEAVIDIIKAKTDRALLMANKQLKGALSQEINTIRKELLDIIAHIQANIDFPEEDIPEADIGFILKEIQQVRSKVADLINSAYAGKIIKEGISTLILGNANVGKSSLLNALLKEERAIVTDIPGTTRDIIEEYIDINGIPIKIIDTAGIRQTTDRVEKIGIKRAMKYLEEAELVLLMIDNSRQITPDDEYLMKLVSNKNTIVVINKVDLPAAVDEKKIKDLAKPERIVNISALTGKGIEKLKEEIYDFITNKVEFSEEGIIAASERQKVVMEKAYEFLGSAIDAIKNDMPVDLVEVDIRDALRKLGEITGDTVSEDIIRTIFQKFCIGK